MEKESQPTSENRGETQGEWKNRVLLEEIVKRGQDGWSISEILPFLRSTITQQDRREGVTDDIYDNDDVSFPLLELQKEGKIRIEEGKVYPVEE